MHNVLRSQGITIGHGGREAALASLEAQGYTGEGVASSELSHHGRDGALASLIAQGFTGEGEASSEQGHRRCNSAVNYLIDNGVDPKKASSELSIHYSANCRKSGTCKFLGGCNKAIRSGDFCDNHKPINAEKSDRCRSCGRVLGVEVKVTGGVCNPCYQKPEAIAARKKATAEKKAARGVCSTPGCAGINHRGHDKCQRSSNDY